MEFFSHSTFANRTSSDVLFVPFVQKKDHAVIALKDFKSIQQDLKDVLESGDFRAKEGEIVWIYGSSEKEQRIALLGLGHADKMSVERLRRAYGALAKACLSKKLKAVNVCLPEILKLSESEIVRGVVEGILLTNYLFNGKKTSGVDKTLIKKVGLVGCSVNGHRQAEKFLAIAKGVYLARDLVNGNADDVTPEQLSLVAKGISKQHPSIKATIFDKKRLTKENFGLLLAVGRGSAVDPALIVLEYRGNPKSKVTTVFVGKGVTYDTGGLNLKPTGSMETMRADMAGAAAALGAIAVAAELHLKQNVVVVIPTTENSIGSRSYKPGDVYTGYAGKSVEIGNTDAEGRLILADALAYAVKKWDPTFIIDLATLTGAMDIALGSEFVGLFSNDDKLSALIEKASLETYERAWRLPLVDEYREQLKSEIADLKNIGGKGAGSIKGALFLEKFVGDTPWAHLDIAAAAYAQDAKRYLPKYGTGIGVRLLVEFLEAVPKL